MFSINKKLFIEIFIKCKLQHIIIFCRVSAAEISGRGGGAAPVTDALPYMQRIYNNNYLIHHCKINISKLIIMFSLIQKHFTKNNL